MSRHHYHAHHGVAIEALDNEGRAVKVAAEILFTYYGNNTGDSGVFGRISFDEHLPRKEALRVDAVVIYGLGDDDEIFYRVLEEVSLSDEPDGPQKNHYGFSAETMNDYLGVA